MSESIERPWGKYIGGYIGLMTGVALGFLPVPAGTPGPIDDIILAAMLFAPTALGAGIGEVIHRKMRRKH